MWRERVDIQKLRYLSLSFLFRTTHYFAPPSSISNCFCMNIIDFALQSTIIKEPN